jgi:hypothetical protein
LSTWVVGGQDQENLKFLEESGNIQSVRILTDRSYKQLKPSRCARLRELFGDDALLITRIHAKFALIANDDWKISIRSSMNLNRNPRWEQFDIDDSAEIHEFFAGLVNEIARSTPDGIASETEDVNAGFWASGLRATCGGEVMVPENIDVLARITQLAGLQFTPREIATMTGIEGDLADDQYAAYLKGQLIAEEGVRRTLLAQAGSGDMKAISEFNKLIEDRKRATKTYRRESS